jgi:DNA polymerase sigma
MPTRKMNECSYRKRKRNKQARRKEEEETRRIQISQETNAEKISNKENFRRESDWFVAVKGKGEVVPVL